MTRARLLSIVVVGACGFHPSTGDTPPHDGAPPTDSARALDAPPGDAIAPPPIDAPPLDAGSAASQCLAGMWCRRRAITVVGSRISAGPHAHFPLLVSITGDGDLAANTQPTGNDIRFTDADGVTPLPYERESFVQATGTLLAWVNVPVLSSSTRVYLYYGATGGGDQQQPGSAWDPSFPAVYHLDDATGARKDSTMPPEDAAPTAAGGITQAGSGAIGAAAAFDGTSYLRAGSNAELTATAAAGTIELWVQLEKPVSGGFQFFLSSSNSYPSPGSGDGYSLAVDTGGNYYFYPWTGAQAYDETASPFLTTAWHAAAVSWSFTGNPKIALYVDGTPRAITNRSDNQWTTVSSPADWLWGGALTPGATTYFKGALDEIHVSNVVRTAGWIQTAYDNESSPGTFYALGSAETLAP